MSEIYLDEDDDFQAQGMSDEDLSAIDGIWTSLTGEIVEDGPVSELVMPEVPRAEPVGLEAAKEAAEATGPDVFPWRTAGREPIRDQWVGLREFVEWVVRVYRFQSDEHMPCWWMHPEIVQEWVAMRHLYDLSWSTEDAGGGPNNWHYWLQVDRQHLRDAWGRTGCKPAVGHKAPRVVETQEHATMISDEQWAELTGSTTPYEQPEQWPFRPLQDPATSESESDEPVSDTNGQDV